MQLPTRFKVASAIIFYLVSPCAAFIIPLHRSPAATVQVQHRHLLRYPDNREFVLSHNLRHNQWVGISPSVDRFNHRRVGPIPFYTTTGHVALSPVMVPPPAPPAPVEIVTEAPAPPPTTTAEPVPVVTTTTAAPTTLPPPTTTAAPVVVETPAPAPVVPEAPAPAIVEAPAPVAPAAPAPAAVITPLTPQVITIQQPALQGGFPQGIIAVQPIITHGGLLNLGSGGINGPSGASPFLPSSLFGDQAIALLQALLRQPAPAAAPAPTTAEPVVIVTEAAAPPAPVVTEAPTTVAPIIETTPLATTTTQAPPAPETTVAPTNPPTTLPPPVHPGLPTAPELPAHPVAPQLAYLPGQLPQFNPEFQPFDFTNQIQKEAPSAPEAPAAHSIEVVPSLSQQISPESYESLQDPKFLIRVEDAQSAEQPAAGHGIVERHLNNGGGNSVHFNQGNGQTDYGYSVSHSGKGGASFSRFNSVVHGAKQPRNQYVHITPSPAAYGQRIVAPAEDASSQGWQPAEKNNAFTSQVHGVAGQYDFAYAVNDHTRGAKRYRSV